MSQLALPHYPAKSKYYKLIAKKSHTYRIKHGIRIERYGGRNQQKFLKIDGMTIIYPPDLKQENGKVIKITKFDKNTRRLLVKFLGNKCKQCGFDDIRALQIDHINGGGNKEYEKYGNSNVYYFYLTHFEKAKKNIQVLCANCNMIKTQTNNERRYIEP